MTAHKTTPLPNQFHPESEPEFSSEPIRQSIERKEIWWAVLIGGAVFFLGGAMDWLLVKEHASLRSTIELSDALSGLIAAGLGYKVVQSYRQRQEQVRKRLSIIADMNHHVRNALQVISLSAYSSSDREHLEAVKSSVNRIQWALRELLPKM